MATKESSVKKYVVRLSGEEREQLEALIRKGESPAQRPLKARILLKADVADGGEGWSDSRIIKALDTSVSMIYRVRKPLAEEGFEAVLSRKQRATPAIARIFDGEKEAKLVALACSKPPEGRVRWTLRLLENTLDSHSVARIDTSDPGQTLGYKPEDGENIQLYTPTNNQSSEKRLRRAVQSVIDLFASGQGDEDE